jgi:hypothetical protein
MNDRKKETTPRFLITVSINVRMNNLIFMSSGIILVTSSFITFWLEWNAVPARAMIGKKLNDAKREIIKNAKN